ncbi:hypothetical protein V2J09_000614, partial [Rumex salicifolius]
PSPIRSGPFYSTATCPLGFGPRHLLLPPTYITLPLPSRKITSPRLNPYTTNRHNIPISTPLAAFVTQILLPLPVINLSLNPNGVFSLAMQHHIGDNDVLTWSLIGLNPNSAFSLAMQHHIGDIDVLTWSLIGILFFFKCDNLSYFIDPNHSSVAESNSTSTWDFLPQINSFPVPTPPLSTHPPATLSNSNTLTHQSHSPQNLQLSQVVHTSTNSPLISPHS